MVNWDTPELQRRMDAIGKSEFHSPDKPVGRKPGRRPALTRSTLLSAEDEDEWREREEARREAMRQRWRVALAKGNVSHPAIKRETNG